MGEINTLCEIIYTLLFLRTLIMVNIFFVVISILTAVLAPINIIRMLNKD